MITRCTMTSAIGGQSSQSKVPTEQFEVALLHYHKFRLNLFASARKEML